MNLTTAAATTARRLFPESSTPSGQVLTLGLPETSRLSRNQQGQRRGEPSRQADSFFQQRDRPAGSVVARIHVQLVTRTARSRLPVRSSDVTQTAAAGWRSRCSVLSLGGIGLAAVLGWVVAGTALAPVRHLTEASEHVARTRDLSRRIEARGRDELARLAGLLQHHARGARRLAQRPAPAGRRRLARAENAADDREDERRGAAASRAVRRRSGTRSCATSASRSTSWRCS